MDLIFISHTTFPFISFLKKKNNNDNLIVTSGYLQHQSCVIKSDFLTKIVKVHLTL